MFSLNFKRIHYTVDHFVVRNLRSRIRKPDSLGPNPGLDKRVQAFREEGLQILDSDAEEFVEQSASDFSKAGESYSEHLNETLIGKRELRHHIIKQKYFKDNMPNLLTWSEKEQIRYLANTRPDEWTPETIAESFPVTPAVVKKLLKYPWKPATENRIARHDNSTMRNWKELKEGTLPIPDDLRQHFLKFSNRTIPPLKQDSFKIELKSEKVGEFERIIQRCAAKDDKNENYNNYSKKDEEIKEATKTVRKDTKRMTLDELKIKIKTRLHLGNDVDINDQLILNSKDANFSELSSKDLNHEIQLQNKSENKELMHHNKDESDNTPAIDYPERIRIPKKAYKRGATYKVNDCFYDHDGRFLYRVLGMSN